MPDFESFQVITRPGDSTGVGTVTAVGDINGLRVNTPAHMKRGNDIFHHNQTRSIDLIATVVSRAVYVPAVGIWELRACSYVNRVAGTDGSAVTGDIVACASGQAPASGTTCLSAANAINLKTAADTPTPVAMATTRPQVGPGGYFGFLLGGTATSLVSTITCEFARVA